MDQYRSVPDILIKFLEREEGERHQAYKDLAGMYTCGVGSTTGVTSTTWWDQACIDQHLLADLQEAVIKLYWAIGPAAIAHLNDYQYAALLSFVFNVGEKADWHVWGDIRRGELSLVPAQLRLFTAVKGKPGVLTRRRDAEINLWNGDDKLCSQFPLKAASASPTPSKGPTNVVVQPS